MVSISVHHGDLPANLRLEGDIAVDTETMGLQILTRDRLCVVQLCDAKGRAHVVQLTPEDYAHAPHLKALLADPARTKIMHYARFDLTAIQHYLGVAMAPVFCTKIASRLTRTYTDKHGLKELCKEIVNVDLSKQQQSSYWGATELSKSQVEYAASDVIYLHAIRDYLKQMLVSLNRMEMAEQCFQFLRTRIALDMAGWPEEDIFAH